MEHAPYLLVTSDYGVELSTSGLFNQVLGVFLQTLIVFVCTLALHVLSLTKSLDGSEHVFLVGAGIFQDAGCCRVAFQNGEQNRLYAYELVAHLLGSILGVDQYLIGVIGEVWLSATLYAGKMLQFLLQEHGDLSSVHAQLLEDIVGHIRCFLDDSAEKMHRLDGLLTISLRCVHSGLHRFLRLDCKFVECHIFLLSCFMCFVMLFVVCQPLKRNVCRGTEC